MFLSELAAEERLYSGNPDGFVGLARFVNFQLGSKGYSPASSREMIDYLASLGVVEVYYVPNPFHKERKTAAIRRIPPPAVIVSSDPGKLESA